MSENKYIIELDEKELQEVFLVMSEEREKEESVYKFRVALRNECMVKLMYYAALESSELIELKISDVDLNKEEIKINKGDNSYRLRIVDKDLINLLKLHKRYNKPMEYFFENISRGNKAKLSNEMVQKVIKKVFEKAQIENYYKIFAMRIRCTKLVELQKKYKFTDSQLFYWVGYQKQINQTEVENLYQKLSMHFS